MDEVYEVENVVDSTLEEYRAELKRVLRRRERAAQLMAKAESDFAVVSGSIMALESLKRRIAQPADEKESRGPRGPRPSDAENEAAIAATPTLAG